MTGLVFYQSLRSSLAPSTPGCTSTSTRDNIAGGLIHHGKFEGYLRFFGSWVLPLIHSRETIRDLLTEKDQPARCAFFRNRWDTWRWRLFCRILLSPANSGAEWRETPSSCDS